jgi:tetratricopeptide (TPR) repeat protein
MMMKVTIMIKSLCISIILLANNLVQGQTDKLQYYYAQAHEAQQAGDNARFYEMIVKASEIHPHHPSILYQRGTAAALNGKNEEAISYLRKALLMNANFELDSDELKTLRGIPEFKALQKLQIEILKPIIKSDTAFVLPYKQLHAETITAGERDGVFYLSGIHQRKVLRIDPKRNITEFTTAEQDGLTAVLGLKVNAVKNELWICSSPMPEMQHYDTVSKSAVFKYNIKSKKLIKKYQPTDSKTEYNFGDLILNKKGEAFISDSRNNIIFKVNESKGNLEPFYSNETFWNIQGITFSSDEKYLFISDYIKGLYRLTLATKELLEITAHELASLKSIDGLHWYNNSLIAVQNGITPMRVTRYMLNEKMDSITSFEILDRAHPAFNEPTNGCIVNDAFIYVANSQWSGYDEQKQQKPIEQLEDIIILKAYLKAGR